VDDTASLRLGMGTGPEVLMAVSLCGTDFIAGEITIDGTRAADE
jgi:hypothetical protein